MHFVIISGAEIREYVERHDSAKLALERASELFARRLPNIRIFNDANHLPRLADLRRVAEKEYRYMLTGAKAEKPPQT